MTQTAARPVAGMPPAPGTQSAKPRQRRGVSSRDAQAGDLLKAAYTFERRLYDSARKGVMSRYKPAAKFDGVEAVSMEDKATENVWVKMARDLTARRIDPAEYVRLVFAELGTRTDPVPAPNQLLAARYREIYSHARSRTPDLLADDLQDQRRLARSEILSAKAVRRCSMLEAVNRILTDPTITLTPLFRVVMALSMKTDPGMTNAKFRRYLRPVIDQYKSRAFIQYARNAQAYNEAWAGWIDGRFREVALRYYDRQAATD